MRVHNHGPEDGPGLACNERLVGSCILTVDEALASGVVVSARDVRELIDRKEAEAASRPVLFGGHRFPAEASMDELRSLLRGPATDAAPTDRGCVYCQAKPGQWCEYDCGGPSPAIAPEYRNADEDEDAAPTGEAQTGGDGYTVPRLTPGYSGPTRRTDAAPENEPWCVECGAFHPRLPRPCGS